MNRLLIGILSAMVIAGFAPSRAAEDGAVDDVCHVRAHTGERPGCQVVAFSADGRRIFSCGFDRTIRSWNSQTGKDGQTITHVAIDVNGMAFSPDGRRAAVGPDHYEFKGGQLVTATDFRIRVLELSGRLLLHYLDGHTDGVRGVAFSPDGKRILTGSDDQTARIWDTETGKELQRFTGSPKSILAVAFLPDGRRIVTGGLDNTVRIWDVESGRELLTLRGHTDQVLCVAASPDGKLVAAGSFDNSVRLWNTEIGQEVLTLKGHTARVLALAFSPDGKYLLSGGGDTNHDTRLDCSARLWQVASGQQMRKWTGHNSWVTSVAFSADGDLCAAADAEGIIVVRKVPR